VLRAIPVLLATTALLAADNYVIQTVAGGSATGDNGPASSALLLQAEGVTIDGLGNVYFADAGANRVSKISPNGMIQTVAGNGTSGLSGDGGAATAAQLNQPYGIALDLAGNLYIADLGNARVRKVDAAGIITSIAGGGTSAPSSSKSIQAVSALLQSPRNVAFDATGNLYITDFSAQQVYKVDATGVLTVFAGTGKSGYGGDGASAALAQLSYPAGVAADAQGSIYIADSGNNAVRRVWYGNITTVAAKLPSPTGVALDSAGRLYIASPNAPATAASAGANMQVVAANDVASDPGGTLYLTTAHLIERLIGSSLGTIAGTTGAANTGDGGSATLAGLSGPVALAITSAGDIYVAEQTANRIRKIAAGGTISTVVANSSLKAPAGVAVDSSGNVYFADTGNNAVRRISATGIIADVATMLNAPSCLRLGSDGSLYICDTGNNRILKVTAAGSQSMAASIAKPTGLAVAADGTLYVASGSQVVKFSPSGATSTALGQLSSPAGLAIDSSGNLLVAESGMNRVLTVDSAGTITVLAGTGTSGFSGDGGAANAAQLNNPLDVILDASGNILIADTGNNRIRKLTSAAGAAGLSTSNPSTTPPATTPPTTTTTPATPATLNVVNAASQVSGPVAPNEIVTIYGSGFVPSNTQVTFDSVAATIFYAGPKQLNVLVPATVKPNATTALNIMVSGASVGSATLNTTPSNPALFTVSAGTGAAAALNQDGSANSDANPAIRGTVVSLFLTGDGQSGGQATVTIAGYAADVLFSGPAPGLPGLTQVNLRVPSGFMPPGDQPVRVTMNGAPTQSGVTLSVQ